MSVHVSSAVWRMRGVAPGLKLVLLALADMASDEGDCWPSMRSLTERTGLSERAIQGHLSAAEGEGLIQRSMRDGRSTVYTVRVGTPAESAPPQNLHPTPAESAPRNINRSINTPSTRERARGSRWKRVQNFPPPWLVWAQEETGWTAITVHRVSDEFQDYWCGKAGSAAAKADWESTWRNWVRREVRHEENRGGGRGGRSGRGSAVERVARATAEWERQQDGGEAVAAHGRGLWQSMVIEHGRVAEPGVDGGDLWADL